MTIQDRINGARAYLSKLPAAISGQGGHPATYRAASILANGFDLSWDDAWALLNEYNLRCSPPWSEKELRHKLNDAFVKPHERPKGWLNTSGTRSVSANGRLIFDPKRIAEIVYADKPLGTADLLLAAFKDDEIVCITNEAGQNEDGKYFPASKGNFLKRAEWITRFFGPGTKGAKHFEGTEQGAWIRINPLTPNDFSGSDTSVSSYRHVLVEFDKKAKDEQVAIFHQSNLPITALIESGGKSVHAWVRVDAESREQFEQRRNAIYEYLSDHEPDPQNKNPSRWSRLGGVMRGEKEQKVLALNVGAENWDAWINWKEGQDFPDEIRTDYLETYDINNDPNHVIGLGRWLCKGGSLLVTGQSGIGKSSFTMQMACSWALGRELFGIPVKRPLRIGVIQAECDTGDLAQAYQGVTSAMDLTRDEKVLLKENLRFFTETSKYGKDFAELIRKVIIRLRLDMLIADPLLSYIGGDISKQETASYFLRNLIQPILKETGCMICFIHHEGKPKPKEVTDNQSINDMAYSGTGSAELTNWARAIINIRRESKDYPVFSFNMSKRGNLSGLRDRDGKPTLSLKLRHATGKVLWEIAPISSGLDLLKIGEQYAHFSAKPRTARGALLKELMQDFGLRQDQAEAVIKGLVTNGIMAPKKIGTVVFYEGTSTEE